MSYSPPTAPETLPDDIVESLDDYSADLLRDVARYAEELAEHREREARLAEDDQEEDDQEEDDQEEDDQEEKRTEDLPDDVPSKATITIKEINDNRYYYWQWREGGKIKSKYKAPVDADS